MSKELKTNIGEIEPSSNDLINKSLEKFNANNYEEWSESIDNANKKYANMKTLLFIIILNEVNIHNFRHYIIGKDWTYEQYIDEENDPNTNGHQFAYSILSEAEFNFLKKNIKELIGEK